MNDSDIGRCDYCGSEEGERSSHMKTIEIRGEPREFRVWSCQDYRPGRLSAVNPFKQNFSRRSD